MLDILEERLFYKNKSLANIEEPFLKLWKIKQKNIVK